MTSLIGSVAVPPSSPAVSSSSSVSSSRRASTALRLIVVGRLVAGVSGSVLSPPSSSSTCPRSAPRKVRGALVSGYQFCITIGLCSPPSSSTLTQNSTRFWFLQYSYWHSIPLGSHPCLSVSSSSPTLPDTLSRRATMPKPLRPRRVRGHPRILGIG